MKFIRRLFCGPFSLVLFWGYNLIYIFFLFIILLNFFAFTPAQNRDFWTLLTFGGALPTGVLISIYALLFTPWISIMLALIPKIRNAPTNVAKLFFGFQIPLIFLLLVRIVFLRQLTPKMGIILAGVGASVLGLLILLFRPKIEEKWKLTILLAAQQIALVVASYALLLSLFFLPIMVALAIKFLLASSELGAFLITLFQMLFRGEILQFLLAITFLTMFSLTAAFFTFGPLGSVAVFWSNLQNLQKELGRKTNVNFPRLVRVGVSAIFVISVIILSIPPSIESPKNLAQDFKSRQTFEEQQKAALKIKPLESQIKGALIDTYLAPYRYLTDQKMNLLKQGFTSELSLSPETASLLQGTFNNLALPFIFPGNLDDGVRDSAEAYSELFDESIQKGEIDKINQTLEETNTQDTLKAGVLDLKRKTVRLISRNVNVQPVHEGQWAIVTVEEEFENTTQTPQEVYYEFTLPENAAVTELKLGPDLQLGANLADKRIPQRNEPKSTKSPVSLTSEERGNVRAAEVAAQGAAHQVYEGQIFRRTDPALLSQTGPRQYRLRIFPIPPKGQTIDGLTATLPQKNQKVRYSYITPKGNAQFPLPEFVEQRNVHQDSSTQSNFASVPSTSCPQQSLETLTSLGIVSWIPNSSLLAGGVYNCTAGKGRIKFDISGQNLAILIDSSYSNRSFDVKGKLVEINNLLGRKNNVHVYFFTDRLSKSYKLSDLLSNNVELQFLGKTNRFSALKEVSVRFDAIFMFTDGSAADAKPVGEPISVSTPIYVIHDQGKIPPYHQTLTSSVFQTQGRVENSLDQAIQDYKLSLALRSVPTGKGKILSSDELGTWILRPAQPGGPDAQPVTNLSDPFTTLAQKQLIINLISVAGANLENVDFLDKINTVSKESRLVSPYSSMIVLVTAAQREQLQNALKDNNRYQLDLDTGEETLGNPSGSNILELGAVPEPHEWLLIFAGSLLLIFVKRKSLIKLALATYEKSRMVSKH